MITKEEEEKLDSFLHKLTDLSQEFQIGITEKPVLYIMEAEDRDRSYECDELSRLIFE